ncbi:hypothetical protein B1F68_05320, partial [Pseudomonas syringae]
MKSCTPGEPVSPVLSKRVAHETQRHPDRARRPQLRSRPPCDGPPSSLARCRPGRALQDGMRTARPL